MSVRSANLSWEGIYFFGFLVGSATLIGINHDHFKQWFDNWQASKRRIWNVTIIEAIQYIASGSYFSNSLHDSEREKRAIDTFREAATKGQVRVAGCAAGSSLLSEIPKRIWRSAELKIDSLYGRTRVRLTAKKNETSTLFSDLFVDGTEMKRVWPPKPVNRRI